MSYVIGAVVGVAWGCLAAYINFMILQKTLEKGSDKLLLGSNLLRMVVDVVALAAVFLVRNVAPFDFYAAIIGTAAGMSLLTIVLAFKSAAGSKEEKPQEPETKD